MFLLRSKYSYETNTTGTVQFGIKMGEVTNFQSFYVFDIGLIMNQFYCCFHDKTEVLCDKQ
jgi:hypothetical protein